MQEQEQTLASPDSLRPSYEMDKLGRWLDIQPILDEVFTEREAQIARWGTPTLPLGFGGHTFKMAADQLRKECDEATDRGDLTLRHILLEEFYEALAESDLKAARDELVQSAAVHVQAIQRIDTLLSEAAE